jgi:membrane protein YdbS with pleckstrin-like domain
MSEFSSIERWVLRVLRVPPDPDPPEGSRDSVQIFHAGRNFYLWCLLQWLVFHVAVLTLLITVHFATKNNVARSPEAAQIIWRVVESALFLAFAGSAFITFFSQRLNYRLRWYIVTDHCLRIRSGILVMEELTMTFSNIQEIRVSAGPLQNLLKIADVEVHSAGGGSGGKKGDNGHMGCFEGVSNSNAIRDLMIERLRRYRDSGLGEAAQESPVEDQTLEAARAVLAETRSLREYLAPGASD